MGMGIRPEFRVGSTRFLISAASVSRAVSQQCAIFVNKRNYKYACIFFQQKNTTEERERGRDETSGFWLNVNEQALKLHSDKCVRV